MNCWFLRGQEQQLDLNYGLLASLLEWQAGQGLH